MFQKCADPCGDCCQAGEQPRAEAAGLPQVVLTPRGYEGTTLRVVAEATDASPRSEGVASVHRLHGTQESVRSVTQEHADRSRAVALAEETERQWVAITAYQPIDTVTKTVEVPVVRTVETYVPKVVVEEKIVEVPKYVPEYVEKVVEVPEVQYVDKIVEVPEYQYEYKYVPKVDTQENVIQRPKYETKYIEKIVEVPQIKEVVRYQEVEEVEEVIRYVAKDSVVPEEWKRIQEEQEKREEELKQKEGREEEELKAVLEEERKLHEERVKEQMRVQQQIIQQQLAARAEEQRLIEEKRQAEEVNYHLAEGAPPMPAIPKVEQVFKPKVIKQVEIQKHVPISVDVPVPYMVPKPVVVSVQVPVLKFRDHFVPVPVRRRVVPRIRWTNEVYEVECIKEKPFLQVQDVIKPVPCDVEIRIHEYVEKAAPINPAELSQADIHAMWMRVNADLAEKRKQELGDKYPYVKHPQGTVFGEPGCSAEEGEEGGEQREGESGGAEPLALHPGHPLNMTYLQNEWIKKDTISTHEMYTPEWFEAHQKALYNLTMQQPTQVQLSAEQAAQLQQQQAQFGDAPWMEESRAGATVRSQDGASESSQAQEAAQ
ncbi:alveolin domain containing intermediate filament IMC1 [Besnoitia besnoiti]|uniref:Alveolin domain containing intermediate filament IMC1 n=1 Tax=Besnoitia besnoiti TaxID=94643 RepID=A0A2A9MQ73_BESBE|nr:alveolin domain containing intermediate filament IMC1 [Besnoitia besnoiti]PFH38636.1 alveolin domain containing intermediate filament IMC1 [Besnoitia besnoiti]